MKALDFCDQCEAVSINGMACHESGCPNTWRNPRKCTACGDMFTPAQRHNKWCLDCSMTDDESFDVEEGAEI